MITDNFLYEGLDDIFDDINYDINLLYAISSDSTKNLILNHLRDKIFMLEYAIKTNGLTRDPRQQLLPMQLVSPEDDITFTLQDLSRFDGKNGNSVYIAIDGIVYDVTDNVTWAAASHFGLTAGNDLTREFVSCHGGQPILSKLKVVGRLVENEQ